jgi:MarR-like DNA-binding transcriptional regulator SgrR of sgrS sRNA
MKPISLLLVAALNVSCLASAQAATRPRYGGSLQMEARGALISLDTTTSDSYADRQALRDRVVNAVCDRLVTLDNAGNPQASLASAWRSEREGRSWHFTLRPGVPLHSGSMLSPQLVVTALSGANPNWHIRMEGGEMLIQSDVPVANMLAQLAQSRNAVCIRGDSGQWIGTGPFFIADFQPGKTIQLRAFNDCWRGRPYLDRIDIEMGKSLSEQASDLELGRANLVEADPTQPRPQSAAGASASAPDELLALVFSTARPAAQDVKLREAIAKSIDRSAIFQVLLRRQGEPSASLLPEWISGYAHLFNGAQDLAAARQLHAELTSSAPLSLAYDSPDPVAKLVAERISVNAREAGIVLQPYGEMLAARAPNADVKLVRMRIDSPDPAIALGEVETMLGVGSPQKTAKELSIDAVFQAERETLKSYLVIPIAHVPEAFSFASSLHDWAITPWGSLRLEDLWIEATP